MAPKLVVSTIVAAQLSACGGAQRHEPASPKEVVVAPAPAAEHDEPTPLPARSEPSAAGYGALACSAGARDEGLSRGRAEFQEAVAAFEKGDYSLARERFESAYQLTCKPAILFNLAVCHERLGEPSTAADVYEQYLRESPDSPTADRAREKIRALRGQSAP